MAIKGETQSEALECPGLANSGSSGVRLGMTA